MRPTCMAGSFPSSPPRLEPYSTSVPAPGATPEGRKELIGFQVGVRESAQSWRELLLGVKQRGLQIAPEIAVGDSALGFWKALDEIFPGARHQRCWVHRERDLVEDIHGLVQANMKKDLRKVYWARPTGPAVYIGRGTRAFDRVLGPSHRTRRASRLCLWVVLTVLRSASCSASSFLRSLASSCS